MCVSALICVTVLAHSRVIRQNAADSAALILQCEVS